MANHVRGVQVSDAPDSTRHTRQGGKIKILSQSLSNGLMTDLDFGGFSMLGMCGVSIFDRLRQF